MIHLYSYLSQTSEFGFNNNMKGQFRHASEAFFRCTPGALHCRHCFNLDTLKTWAQMLCCICFMSFFFCLSLKRCIRLLKNIGVSMTPWIDQHFFSWTQPCLYVVYIWIAQPLEMSCCAKAAMFFPRWSISRRLPGETERVPELWEDIWGKWLLRWWPCIRVWCLPKQTKDIQKRSEIRVERPEDIDGCRV